MGKQNIIFVRHGNRSPTGLKTEMKHTVPNIKATIRKIEVSFFVKLLLNLIKQEPPVFEFNIKIRKQVRNFFHKKILRNFCIKVRTHR